MIKKDFFVEIRLTSACAYSIINHVVRRGNRSSGGKVLGSIAQLGEHLPYKQRVTGSSPVVPTKNGPVVQLVRTLACHARGRGFEPHPGRQNAFVAQSVEQRTENPRVVGSIPTEGTKRGFSSSGRAPPCQGGGSEFEPRNPLQQKAGKKPAFFSYLLVVSSVVLKRLESKKLFGAAE